MSKEAIKVLKNSIGMLIPQINDLSRIKEKKIQELKGINDNLVLLKKQKQEFLDAINSLSNVKKTPQ